MFKRLLRFSTALIGILFSIASFGQQNPKLGKQLDSVYRIYAKAVTEEYTYMPKLKDLLASMEDYVEENYSIEDFNEDTDKFIYYGFYVQKYARTKQFDSLAKYSKLADELSLPSKYIYFTHGYLGITHDHSGNIRLAVQAFLNGLEFAKLHNNEEEIAKFLNHIVYLVEERFNDDVIPQEQKEELYEFLKENYGEDFINISRNEEPPNSMIKYLYVVPQNSVFNPEIEETVPFVKQKFNEILELEKNKENDKIKLKYEELLKFYGDKDKENYLYYTLIYSYAQFLVARGDINGAAKQIERIRHITEFQIGYDIFDYKSFLDLAISVYERLGDYKNTLYYYKLKIENSHRTIASGRLGYNYLKDYLTVVSQKDDEIERHENEIKQQKSKTRWYTALALVLTFLIVSLIFIQRKISHNRHLKKINKNLEIEKQKVEAVLFEKLSLEQRVENYQVSVSRDLHDNFGNQLSGIINAMEIINELLSSEKQDWDLFQKFSAHLNANLLKFASDIKDLIWASDPKNDNLSKLLDRIDFILDEFKKTTSIEILLFIDVAERDIKLPIFWNRQLVLITKEAVTNSIKHSKTTKIEVLFVLTDLNKLELQINDFGVGFCEEDINRHSGLKNMKKRAETINCSYNLSSSENGTKIKIIGDLKMLSAST